MVTKNCIGALFMVAIILLFISSIVMANEGHVMAKGEPISPITIYYPDKMNVFEPFKITIDFHNKEYRNKINSIYIGNCNTPFEEIMGFTESKTKLIGRNEYQYEGEEEIIIDVTLIQDGELTASSDVYNNWFLYPCDISFKNKDSETEGSIGLSVDFYPFEFGLKDIPNDFILKQGEKYEFSKYYERKDSATVNIYTALYRFDDVHNNHQYYTFEDLKLPILSSWNYIDDFTIEQPNFNGKPAPYMYKCSTFGYEGKIKGECFFVGHIIMPPGPVIVELTAKQDEFVRTEADMQPLFDEWKKIYLDALRSVYMESQGKTIDFTIDETDENVCGNCKDGFTCGACGDCIKEAKAYSLNEVFTSINPKITQTSKSIDNAIESKVLFKIYPELSIKTKLGKKISYCDLKAPGFTGIVLANVEDLMQKEEPYSGFTEFGRFDEERTKSDTCSIDFKESKPHCSILLQPNDQKKFMADAKDMQQLINFNVQVNDESLEYAKFVELKAPDFQLKFKSKGHQVQQGSNKVFEISTKGATTESVIIKASLMGPGGIGQQSYELNKKWVIEALNSEDSLKIGYHAPSMGNFDIGEELQSLSMVNLQKAAAAQIAEDTFMAYAGEHVGNVEKLVEAGKYTSKMGKLTEAFKLANGAKTIRGVNDGMDGLTENVGNAMGVTEGKKYSSWSEKIADVGIAGISIAQTAVSVVTFIPNKLPGVGKLSAGVQAAFSAATNIWKANLKYISKSEKIERAEELYYPAVVVVTAQDISGWTTQDMFTFKITYQEIN